MGIKSRSMYDSDRRELTLEGDRPFCYRLTGHSSLTSVDLSTFKARYNVSYKCTINRV